MLDAPGSVVALGAALALDAAIAFGLVLAAESLARVSGAAELLVTASSALGAVERCEELPDRREGEALESGFVRFAETVGAGSGEGKPASGRISQYLT